jgi:hypothetical protein
LSVADDVIGALDLPAASRLDQRIPKKLLLENGAPTAADKRHIAEGIEEILWIAALKPAVAGAAVFRDEAREYLEIAFLRLSLRVDAKTARLVELVHRAIPYPVLLITDAAEAVMLSAAHKRWSQGEAGKTVLDGELVSVSLAELDPAHSKAFCDALGLSRQPRASLFALYQGWIDALHALSAARLTGVFNPAVDRASRREALQECARLDAEIARLRAAAAKEKQMSRRVSINLELKKMEASRTVAAAKL